MHKKRKRVGRQKKGIVSFGRFADFPSIIHGTAKITHKTSATRLQRAIAETLRDLNGYRMPQVLSVASHSGVHEGEAAFEVGVADGLYFDYLDEETFKRLVKPLRAGKFFPVLDVLIIVSYHYSRNGRRVSLNFDHHLLRFIFKKEELDLYLFHLKGIRRIPLDEFLNHVLDRVRERMEEKRLETFKIEYLRTL